MDCVSTCEYCKSVNVLIDGESGSIAGHFCKKLNRFVQINKPVEKDCPFYPTYYNYKDLIDLRNSLILKLYEVKDKQFNTIMSGEYISVQDIESIIYDIFDELLDEQNGN